MTRDQANSVQQDIDWVERLTTRKTHLDRGDPASWVVDVYVVDSGRPILRIRDASPVSMTQSDSVPDASVRAGAPAFHLPMDSAEADLGECRTCPTCGAEWQNITSRAPTWVARGYEG